MRGGRFGKYGELKRLERLRESRIQKTTSNKKVVSSRQAKFEHDKKRESNKETKNKPVGVYCRMCKEQVEFLGLKFNCSRCYEKKNIKEKSVFEIFAEKSRKDLEPMKRIIFGE